MLLADGHVVYYGTAQSVLSWFTALGFECPYGVNVADFLLDLAQGEVTGGGDEFRQGGTVITREGSGSSARGGGLVKGGGKPSPAAAADRENGGSKKAAAGGGGDEGNSGELTGQAAVTALWSSYEEFARTHKQGFTRDEQLGDVRLLLEPPAPTVKARAIPTNSKHSVGGGKGSLEEGRGGDAVGGKPPLPRSQSRGSASHGLRALSSMILRRQSGGGVGGSDDEDEAADEAVNREITRVRGVCCVLCAVCCVLCAVLCCAVLCCAVLCCAVLCCAVLLWAFVW